MRRALLILSLLTVPHVVGAQTPQWLPAVSTGTRVRAVVDGSRTPAIVGIIVGATRDTVRLALTNSSIVALAMPSLVWLDVSDGRERGRWAFRGGAIGLLAGGIIGMMAMRDDGAGSLAPIAGLLAGAILGAPTGAIIGAVYAPERWTRYSNPR
jgi:hypothetical protein